MVNSAAQLDSIFQALSDPTRRSILHTISEGEKTVTELARPYSVSLAAISKHIKVLEAARLIHREKRGSFQIVRLNADTLQAAEEWLSYYEKFWNRQLDSLQALFEGEKNDRIRDREN